MTAWLTDYEKIIEFIFNILQTLAIPAVLYLLNQQNEKRKTAREEARIQRDKEEQQRKEELAILREFSTSNIMPLIHEFDKKASNKNTAHEDNWFGILTKRILHEFGGFTPLINNADEGTYKKYMTTLQVLHIIHHRMQDRTMPIPVAGQIMDSYLYTIKNLPYMLTHEVFWRTMIDNNITNLKNSGMAIEYSQFLSDEDIAFNELVRKYNDQKQ